MRRRSLIITVFCLGEIVFAVQLIIQAELLKSEVHDWNKGQKALPDIKGRCGRLASGNCCKDNKTLEALRQPYESFRKVKRSSKYLVPILIPLVVVVGANVLAAFLFNSGTFDLTKCVTKCCPASCIKRMSFLLWSICWLAEIGVGGFVVFMITLAKSNFIAGKLQSQDLCKNSGQTIKANMTHVECFRKLKVCPTTEEQTLIASLLLGIFIIICAVFKIAYRFFLYDDDTERFECVNCCRCPTKETSAGKDQEIIKDEGEGVELGTTSKVAVSTHSKHNSVANAISTSKA